MRWLVDLAYAAAGVVYLPIALYQAAFQGKNRRGWRQRFGGVPVFALDRPRIWIHAVSLGETNATPKLVKAVEKLLPGVEFVFSATTDTGYARAVQLYGADRVVRFPLDFSGVVLRALGRIAPSLIVLVELEVWPNLVSLAAQRGIPVAVVNGRLTERSARRLARLGKLARPMFEKLSWVGAQDEAIASRFRQLGVPGDRVEVTSSLKWDTAEIAERVVGSDALAAALGIAAEEKVWVCGSTGNDEEAIVLDAYRLLVREKGLSCRLAIVPRKPERFDEVARLIEQAGFQCIRRSMRPDANEPRPAACGVADRTAHPEVVVQSASPGLRRGAQTTACTSAGADRATQWGDGVAPSGDRGTRADSLGGAAPAVILGDTMGELRKFYSIASVVFIGRSLVPMGGSDPIEAAALGKPLVVGPDMTNFAAPVEAFRAAGAIREAGSAESLAREVLELLSDPARATAAGQRAREVVQAHQGATELTAARLARVFGQSFLGSQWPVPGRCAAKESASATSN